MTKYKQIIRVEGKCIEDIFRLPCVTGAVKTDRGIAYYVKRSQQPSFDSMAFIGDYLCEDYDGNWHIETNLDM